MGRFSLSVSVLVLLLSAGLVACDDSSGSAEPDLPGEATVTAPSTAETRARFEPPDGTVLVFVGQDNASTGGNGPYRDGYVDHLGVPAGVTHYVYFVEGETNAFDFTFDDGSVDGLGSETTWGAGPMCMRCYLESETLRGTAVHLSISMEFGAEVRVADGEHDHLIDELAAFLEEFRETPFFIRIGYEFDGAWNGYEPEKFRAAWRRIVDRLREAGRDNFATVMASSSVHVPRETWATYWPGDDYVDWLGYSWFGHHRGPEAALDLAREKGKPVMIAEAAPRGFYLEGLGLVWYDWYQPLFQHIEENPDVVKALAYINADWDAQPMWSGWGDSRIQVNDAVREAWLARMDQPGYLHGPEGVYEAIDFSPER